MRTERLIGIDVVLKEPAKRRCDMEPNELLDILVVELAIALSDNSVVTRRFYVRSFGDLDDLVFWIYKNDPGIKRIEARNLKRIPE